MNVLVRVLVAGVLFGAAATAIVAAPAGSETFQVTNGNDSGPGSYRQAIIDAAGATEPVIIEFAPGLTVTLAADVSYAGTQPITLEGNGSTIDGATNQVLDAGTDPLTVRNLTVQNAGDSGVIGGAFRGSDIVIEGSTFIGNTAGIGGAVSSTNGTVVIRDSTFIENEAAIGGAVADVGSGDLTVTNSTFQGNRAAIGGALEKISGRVLVDASTFTDNDASGGVGGSIALGGGASLVVTDSSLTAGDASAGGAIAAADMITVSGGAAVDASGVRTGDLNVAADGIGVTQADVQVELVRTTIADDRATVGGGVVGANRIVVSDGVVTTEGGGSLFAVNTTLSGDAATERGGALAFDEGDVTLVYVTSAGNASPLGTDVQAATLTSFGTVFASEGGTSCDVGTTTSNGYNRSTDASCGLDAATDQESAGDPRLGPLADNGGPTPTRLPLTGSYLIDAIPSAACQDDGAAEVTTDQRGVARPQIGGCDIGAVEVEPVVPALVLQPTFTG